MNADKIKEAKSPEDLKRESNRKRGMLIATAIFILLFIGYGIYYLFVLRYEVTTDNAYVSGIQAPVIAQTSGNVTQVNVVNTDYVKKGDVLVKLDDTNAKISFEQAKSTLANTVRETQQLYIKSDELQAQIQADTIKYNQVQRDYQRRLDLSKRNNISVEDLQHAKESLELAQLQLDMAKQSYQANLAMINGVTLEEQPSVKTAADNVRQAWLALERTNVRSPIDGYVARSNVQVGAEVGPESSLMVIVPTSPVWVDANFKETQLQSIRIGQPVTIESDIYGSEITYHGKIVGINMGTGSAFSLLPAQNATGNWIKIVQRVPVRIEIDQNELAKYPLRIGLSMNVTVDVRDQNGAFLASETRNEPFYESNALVINTDTIDAQIQTIIESNKLAVNAE